MVSVQFHKNFTEPPFWGEWSKELQTSERLSKYCVVEFTAIVMCLLLS